MQALGERNIHPSVNTRDARDAAHYCIAVVHTINCNVDVARENYFQCLVFFQTRIVFNFSSPG